MLGLDSLLKQAIFALYVALWVSCHLLVYSSKHGAPAYNSTSVVLITELVKLVMATSLYLCHDGGPSLLARSVSASLPLLAKYSVPALLYCVYNNLVYMNLTFFDPGTYNVLMQLRIIMTGILYQVLFSKRLNRNQWLAIVLISIGCMLKEMGKLESVDSMNANLGAWLLLCAQMLCSVLAGVYNEVLLKSENTKHSGITVTTNLQNCFMYFNSILWNMAFLYTKGSLSEALSTSNLQSVATPTVLAIIAIMSSVGLITGFFLQYLDSVLKAVASAIEVVATCLLSFFLFGLPLDTFTIAAAAMVGYGVALYSRPTFVGRQEYTLLPRFGGEEAVRSQH